MPRAILVSGVLLVLSNSLFAIPNPAAYSADVLMQRRGQTTSGHIYVDRGKTRMEMAQRGQQFVNITRSDRKVAWTIMPNQSLYLEIPLTGKMAPVLPVSGAGVQYKRVGTDVVDGRKADKYSVSVNGDARGFEWIPSGDPFPVRYQSADGQTRIDYSHVTIGPQNPALFELPPGYRKLAVPTDPLDFWPPPPKQ